MADNSVGGLNIRIGADISEGERQIQKFVREFDTALKELSMGRRGGMYTTSAFRSAVEREQSRAQEEFARAGVFGASGQEMDPQAYRGALMRGSGYAALARQEEEYTEKVRKEAELRRMANDAFFSGNIELEQQYLAQINALLESDTEKRQRLAREAAEREVAIANKKRDDLIKAAQDEADALEQLRASQATRMRNLPRDPVTGDIDPNRAAAYMLRRGGEIAAASAIEEGAKLSQQSAERQMRIDNEILLHRQARLEAARDKNKQLEAAHIRIIDELQQSSHDKEIARIRKRGEEEAAAELQRQRHKYESQKRLDAMSATERKVVGLRESGEFEEADRLEQKYLRLRKVLDEINAPVRERAALVERLAVLAELEAEATKRGNTAAIDRIKIDRQRTEERIKQIDTPVAIDETGNAANRARYAVMNLAYGVQDAVTVFGTSGLAGAVRASANNLVALGTLMDQTVMKSGGISAALRSPEVLLIGAVSVIQVVTGLVERYQSLEKAAKAARDAIYESMQMDLLARVETASKRVTSGQATRQADEQGYEALVKLREERERNLEVLQAEEEAAKKSLNDAQLQVMQTQTEIALLKERANIPEKGLTGLRALGDSLTSWWNSFTQTSGQRTQTYGEQLQALESVRMKELETEGKIREQREKSKTAVFDMMRLIQQTMELEGKAANRKAEKDNREMAEREKKKAAEEAADRARQDAADLNEARWMDLKAKQEQERRISDIAITQAERILASRQQEMQQRRQQAQAGPQFASMVAAGTQEDANARMRMRAGTAAMDPLLEESRKQVRQAEEIVRELRMIREEMQPGYMVETFRP